MCFNTRKIKMMKKIRNFLFLFIFLFSFSVHEIQAQTTTQENGSFELHLKNMQTGEVYELSGGLEQIQITPAGTYKRTITFQLDPEDPFLDLAMPYAVIRVSLWADIDGDGEDDIKLKDKRTVITPSGLVKIDFHYNGQ